MIWPFDLKVSACQSPAIAYISTHFGGDSSSRFPFRVRTNRQTNRQTNKTKRHSPRRRLYIRDCRVTIRMTEDRDKWRKYVRGVANPQIKDGWRTEQIIADNCCLLPGIWSDNTVDQKGCQNPARSPRRHEQRQGIFLLSHVYDDLLLSAVTTAATPSGELSVRKRRQLLPKQVMRVVPSGECLRSKVRTVVWVAGKNCVIPLTRAIL